MTTETHPSTRASSNIATFTAAAMLAQQVAGKATRDALFLSSYAVSSVPKAMVVSALLSAAGVFGFTRLLTRVGPTRGVPLVFGASALLLVLEWFLGAGYPRGAAIAVYAHMGLFGATVTSGFWSLLNERFDPHTLRLVVGKITAGGTLGSIVGGLLSWRIAHAMDVRSMLLVMAGMNVLCAAGALNVRGGRLHKLQTRALKARLEEEEGLPPPPSSLTVLRRTPYLRSLALLVTLGAVIQTLLDYVLNAQAVATFGRGEALLTFFAFFYMGCGVVSFLLQYTLTEKVLESFGLAGTVALLPGSLTVSFLVRIVLPPFWTAVVVRGTEAALRGSLYRAGYELLYTPLAPEARRPTKTLIDVGFDRLGTLLGSGLTMALLLVGAHTTDVAIRTLSVVLSLVTFGLSRSLHRGYVAALEENLRTGAIKLDPIDIVDATTRQTMSQTIDSFDRKRLLEEIAAFRAVHAGGGSAPGSQAAPPASASAATLARRSGSQADGAVDDDVDTNADPVLAAIAALRSGDTPRILRALARKESVHPSVVPHVLDHLARPELASAATAYLTSMAPKTTGMLLDVLLDESRDLAVRRRLPRTIAAARTRRAADGLVSALHDDDLVVREQSARALSRLTGEVAAITIADDIVFDIVQRELSREPVTTGTRLSLAPPRDADVEAQAHDESLFGATVPDERIGRSLEHIFTLLSVVLDREILRLAYLALGSRDRNLRGTAIEYLDTVLPERLRGPMGRLVGSRAESPGRARPHAQVVDDLLKSQSSKRPTADDLSKRTPFRR